MLHFGDSLYEAKLQQSERWALIERDRMARLASDAARGPSLSEAYERLLARVGGWLESTGCRLQSFSRARAAAVDCP
jgi:hypothetical protein